MNTTIISSPAPTKSRMSFEIDVLAKNELQRLAKKQDRTPHYLIVTAVKEYIEKAVAQEQAEAQFHQVAYESLQHLRETGLHATQDEVKNWVASLASNPASKIVCHN